MHANSNLASVGRLVVGLALASGAWSALADPVGTCPNDPGTDRVCASPEVINTSWANITRGPNRAIPFTVEQLELTVTVYPSPDSDDVSSFGLPLTDNGFASVVTVAHPSVSGGQLAFSGLGSGAGYPWGVYARSLLRDDFDPTTNPGLAAPWQITVTNVGADGTTDFFGSSRELDPNARPGLVTDVTLSGGGLNPTIAWTATNVSGNELNFVTLFRLLSPSGVRRVHSEAVASGVTSFQIPSQLNVPPLDPQDVSLRLGETYQVLISNLELTADQQSVAGSARTWAEFTVVEDSGQGAIYIPTVTIDPATGNKIFSFDIKVEDGQSYDIDPEVATGYDYQLGVGDPGFRSVVLPDVGDGSFDLILFDASGDPFDTDIDLSAGDEFDFIAQLGAYGVGTQGLARFGIRGIETSAGLDPNSGTAFVTRLTFVADGRFTGTQRPIAVNVPDDTDADGVPDTDDVCPDTTAGQAVDVLGCSSPQRLENACPIGGSYKHHLQYVACVVKEVDTQFKIKLVTFKEAAKIVLAAIRRR